MTTTPQPTVLLLGPTAGGKTSLAVTLATMLPGGGECISADSMQVYRGMDIGTAKPTKAEQGGIPHHLLDCAEPTEPYTVDHWLEAARDCEEDIRKRDRWPIIVGGTNLYVQSWLGGFMNGPEPDPRIRAELEQLEPAELRALLQQVDPPSFDRIHPNDRRRTIRALEVHRLTGQPISALQGQWEETGNRDDVVIVGLDYPVEEINRRINDRVRSMFEAGFVEETRKLHEAQRLGPQAREALGYKQILEHLEGGLDLGDTMEQVKIRTRRFAKQQRTWLRKFQHLWGGLWIKPGSDSTETIADKALAHIKKFPSTLP